MADVIDVQNALVALAAQFLYPNGTAQACAAGVPVRIYAGWPQANSLDSDLAAGIAHVSIYPTRIERNTTRYPKDWQTLAINAATLTLTAAGLQITVGGAMPAQFFAQNVMAMVNGQPYVYATQAGDTLTSIATGLATAIAAGVPGTSSAGAVITLPAGALIDAVRVGATGTSIREIRRQERVFQIIIWADTPAHRDAIAAVIDPALADMPRITLADQSAARLIYRDSPIMDGLQKEKLYRRDLHYMVEFATTQTATDAQVTQIGIAEAVQPDGATAPVSTVTINI